MVLGSGVEFIVANRQVHFVATATADDPAKGPALLFDNHEGLIHGFATARADQAAGRSEG